MNNKMNKNNKKIVNLFLIYNYLARFLKYFIFINNKFLIFNNLNKI